MKTSNHSVHPDVAKAITTLNKALADNYPSKDFAHEIYVEGIIVATAGRTDDIVPDVWTDVEAETAKRAPKKAEAEAKGSPVEDIPIGLSGLDE